MTGQLLTPVVVVKWQRDGVLLASAALLLVYLGACLGMMLLAPKVPYADVWRFLGHFLQAGFPQDVLAPDNGHHEFLPNLVRVAELRVFKGGQWLQIGCGVALLGGTLAVAGRLVKPLPQPHQRTAAWLALLLGLCWLGNERTQGHANETVHAYAVTLFLVCGITWLSRRKVTAVDALLAGICGLGAAFSFGSGIATFSAFFAILLLRRGAWQTSVMLAVVVLLTFLLLHLTGGSAGPLYIAPVTQGSQLLRWLAGPAIYAAWPALDPAIATYLPGALRGPVVTVATQYQALAGPVMLARWPHLLIGLCGLCGLAVMAWRTWCNPVRTALLGIGLSVFALTVGALIVVVRDAYFQVYPEQLLATRYLVWSSLFWCGLLLASVAHAVRGKAIAVAVCCVGLALLPSQLWLWQLGGSMRQVAEQTALAASVGIVDAERALGESEPSDIRRALPLLRDARAEMFAWPEAQTLGSRLTPADGVVVTDLQVHGVDNRIGPPGRRVSFSAASHKPRLLLVDADGVVRGLAASDAASGPNHWLGWMEGNARQAMPTVVAPGH
jgi:hypothetical protein